MPRTLDPSLRRSRFERDFVAITAAFSVLMVLTNVIGTKLFLLFPDWLPQGFGAVTDYHYVVLTTGLVTYPLTFLFTDIASEVWGRRRANYMVALGFLCSVLMLATVHLAGWVPRADRYWADASGQPIAGTRSLVPTPAASVLLAVDDGSALLLAEGEQGLALALIPGEEAVPLRYSGLQRPEHLVPDGQGGMSSRRLRADQRGQLELMAPLDREIPAGSWIVPAVQVRAVTAAGAEVDRPWLLPPEGSLQAVDGSRFDYQQRDGATGLLRLEAEGPPQGAVLGVVDTRSPAQLAQAFQAVFSAPGSLLLASMLAYLVAQFLDVWLFHFWRRVTAGRHLWLRNNGSTMISQLVDTIVVHVIFLPLAFGTPWAAVWQIIIGVYLVKMVLAWLDTPLIYLGVWLAKRRLGYAWSEPVDQDLLGTESGYPAGLSDGLRRLLTRPQPVASDDAEF